MEPEEEEAEREPSVSKRPFLFYHSKTMSPILVDPGSEKYVVLKKCDDYQLKPHFAGGVLRGYVVDSKSKAAGIQPYWAHMLLNCAKRVKPASDMPEAVQEIGRVRAEDPDYQPPAPLDKPEKQEEASLTVTPENNPPEKVEVREPPVKPTTDLENQKDDDDGRSEEMHVDPEAAESDAEMAVQEPEGGKEELEDTAPVEPSE